MMKKKSEISEQLPGCYRSDAILQIEKSIDIIRKKILIAGGVLALSLLSLGLSAQTFGNQKILTYSGIANLDVGQLSSPVFLDIDNDEDDDLIVGEKNGNVKIFTNDGNNNFSFSGNLKADGVNIKVLDFAAPAFADIDGDGDQDLFLGSSGGNINYYYNDGNGNFSSQGLLQADGTNLDVGNWSNPVFMDMDNDSDLDLYVGCHEGVVLIYSNSGSGSFSFVDTLRSAGLVIDGGLRVAPSFADLDSDNDLDLYLGNYDGVIQIYMNDGAGNYSLSGNMQVGPSNIQVDNNAVPEFADIDGDGDLDLYVGSMSGELTYYQNTGSGTFAYIGKLQSEGGEVFGRYISPVFEDIDGDGDSDLIIGDFDGSVKLFINNGSGKFYYDDYLQAGGTNINVGLYAAPAFADIDGDGDRDLYIGGVDGKVKVYINNGSGAYAYAGFLQADGTDIFVTNFSTPCFVDIDGDNDMDLAIGNNPGNIALYTNINGLFTFAGNIQAGGVDIDAGAYVNPRFADLDNDSDMDLYIGEYMGVVKQYLNDGNGVFTASADVQAFAATIDVGSRAMPYFANINGVCGTDLYIGEQNGIIYYYINDVTAPVITSVMEDQVIDAGDDCEAALPDYTAGVTATDNCSTNFTVTQTPVAGVKVSGSYNEVTLTLRDDADNQDQIVFYVSVHDHTSPVITSLYEDQIIVEEGNCQAQLPDYRDEVTFNDNCGGDYYITQTPSHGTVISGNENIVTLKVFDAANNFSEVSFNVAVGDDTNPEITSVHSDKTLEAEEDCQAVLPDYTDELIATDNCDSNPVYSQLPPAGTAVSGSVNTVSLIVTDSYGNEASVEFNVAVEDHSNPAITSDHNDQVLEAVANCEAELPDYTADVVATDNCLSGLVISQSPLAGTIISGNSNNVTLTATDGAGNFDQIEFNVAVEDHTNPTIACVENQVINLAEGQNFYTVSGMEFNPVSIEDNCGVATVENDFNNSESLGSAELPVGITTIVWTVTDNNGNTETCSFEVSVNVFVMSELQSLAEISIYPNPAMDYLVIENAADTNIQITDVFGRVVAELYSDQQSVVDVDLSGLAPGAYLVKLDKSGNQTNLRFIKN